MRCMLYLVAALLLGLTGTVAAQTHTATTEIPGDPFKGWPKDYRPPTGADGSSAMVLPTLAPYLGKWEGQRPVVCGYNDGVQTRIYTLEIAGKSSDVLRVNLRTNKTLCAGPWDGGNWFMSATLKGNALTFVGETKYYELILKSPGTAQFWIYWLRHDRSKGDVWDNVQVHTGF